MADWLGVWIADCCWHRRNCGLAAGRERTEMVDCAAFALVHLGIRRGDAIGGLEPDQTDLDAFCGVCGVFLSGAVFVERRSQNRSFLDWNYLWVPVGAGARNGTAFRRTQSDTRIFSDLCLSADEGDSTWLLAEDDGGAHFRDIVLSEYAGGSDSAAVAGDTRSSLGNARAIYYGSERIACGDCRARSFGLFVLVGFKRGLAVGPGTGHDRPSAVEDKNGDKSRFNFRSAGAWIGGIFCKTFGILSEGRDKCECPIRLLACSRSNHQRTPDFWHRTRDVLYSV